MFSVRGLLAAVALAAASCASITYASNEWRLILRFSFCVGVLTCILALFYRRGERQAFCAGFLLFGVAIALGTWHLDYVDARDFLPYTLRETTKEGDTHRARARIEGRSIIRSDQYNAGQIVSTYLRSVKMSNRADVANDLIVWIVALIGGRLGVHLHRTRDSFPSALKG
jgi:hypothetical protein